MHRIVTPATASSVPRSSSSGRRRALAVEYNDLGLLGNVRVLDLKNRINDSVNLFEGSAPEEVLSTPPLLLGRRRGTDSFESARELPALESFTNTSSTSEGSTGAIMYLRPKSINGRKNPLSISGSALNIRKPSSELASTAFHRYTIECSWSPCLAVRAASRSCSTKKFD